ncbi:MAG TPA: DUF3800 domain-containing protein [Terriglobales bacterium]|nr:DUF3800 domain-containing protein [Terriglobales bacterium]
MPLQAFIDDSGTSAPVLVLSGYISLYYWWESFSEDWQRLLDESPRLAYFKMREAATLSGQFAGMKAADRNKRVVRFIELIKLAAHASITCVIPVAAYKRVVKGNVKKEWDDPYFIATFMLLLNVLDNQIAQKESEEFGRVEFIYDDNPRLAAKVPYWYQLTRSLLRPEARALIAPSPRFEDDKLFPPLQAADLQSWYYRRLFAEKLCNEPFKKDLPKEIFKELDSIPSMLTFLGDQRLSAFTSGKPLEEDRNAPLKRYKTIHEMLEKEDLT